MPVVDDLIEHGEDMRRVDLGGRQRTDERVNVIPQRTFPRLSALAVLLSGQLDGDIFGGNRLERLRLELRSPGFDLFLLLLVKRVDALGA